MRMSIRFMFAATAAVSVFWAQAFREPAISKLKSSAAESQPAATSGLVEFKRLVNSTNFRSYGFQSVEEAASATLGQPAVAFLVRLDQLRDYQASTDATRLLTGADKVFYPVMAGNQVRSSIVVIKGSAGWKATSFGGPQFIQRLMQARESVTPGTPTMEIEVLALSAFFLGELRAGRSGAGDSLYLTPLASQPELNLKVGVADQASRIFAQLAPIARAHNGLPR